MTEHDSELLQRLVVGNKRDGRRRYDKQAKTELVQDGPALKMPKSERITRSNHGKIHAVIRMFDSPVGKVLDFESQI